MANSATQDDAVINGKADQAAIGTTGSVTGGARLAAVETFVSGTAKQVGGGRPADLYISITTAAALKVEMGPTSAVATTIMVSQSAALGVIHLEVPGGWYVKLTGTMANQTCTSILK